MSKSCSTNGTIFEVDNGSNNTGRVLIGLEYASFATGADVSIPMSAYL